MEVFNSRGRYKLVLTEKRNFNALSPCSLIIFGIDKELTEPRRGREEFSRRNMYDLPLYCTVQSTHNLLLLVT